MKVEELIEHLEKFDGNTEVQMLNFDNDEICDLNYEIVEFHLLIDENLLILG
ncbi:MAG: hypothetical protein ACQEQF_00805 [Bacillota bacterium]